MIVNGVGHSGGGVSARNALVIYTQQRCSVSLDLRWNSDNFGSFGIYLFTLFINISRTFIRVLTFLCLEFNRGYAISGNVLLPVRIRC